MPSTQNGDLLSIGEAARRLGVSVTTLRRWDDNGLIASTRTLGGQRRFLAEDVERLRSDARAHLPQKGYPAHV